jgi:hypothetical protein
MFHGRDCWRVQNESCPLTANLNRLTGCATRMNELTRAKRSRSASREYRASNHTCVKPGGHYRCCRPLNCSCSCDASTGWSRGGHPPSYCPRQLAAAVWWWWWWCSLAPIQGSPGELSSVCGNLYPHTRTDQSIYSTFIVSLQPVPPVVATPSPATARRPRCRNTSPHHWLDETRTR